VDRGKPEKKKNANFNDSSVFTFVPHKVIKANFTSAGTQDGFVSAVNLVNAFPHLVSLNLANNKLESLDELLGLRFLTKLNVR